jgi:hypothetical protein
LSFLSDVLLSFQSSINPMGDRNQKPTVKPAPKAEVSIKEQSSQRLSLTGGGNLAVAKSDRVFCTNLFSTSDVTASLVVAAVTARWFATSVNRIPASPFLSSNARICP